MLPYLRIEIHFFPLRRKLRFSGEPWWDAVSKQSSCPLLRYKVEHRWVRTQGEGPTTTFSSVLDRHRVYADPVPTFRFLVLIQIRILPHVGKSENILGLKTQECQFTLLYISYNYYTFCRPLRFSFGVISENEGLDLSCCCLAVRCVAAVAAAVVVGTRRAGPPTTRTPSRAPSLVSSAGNDHLSCSHF